MRFHLIAIPVVLGVLSLSAALAPNSPERIDPTALAANGTIDKRFQAYNIEMVEVTGGRFWKSYKEIEAGSTGKNDTKAAESTPASMNANLYQYRPPINLGNSRLRKLAAALGPTYVRVSGTWANTSYFPDADGPAPATPPKGFNSVLTREQWKGVIDFAHATNAEIISSFATSAGSATRKAYGSRNRLAHFSRTQSRQEEGLPLRSLSTNPIFLSSAEPRRATTRKPTQEIWPCSARF